MENFTQLLGEKESGEFTNPGDEINSKGWNIQNKTSVFSQIDEAEKAELLLQQQTTQTRQVSMPIINSNAQCVMSNITPGSRLKPNHRTSTVKRKSPKCPLPKQKNKFMKNKTFKEKYVSAQVNVQEVVKFEDNNIINKDSTPFNLRKQKL